MSPVANVPSAVPVAQTDLPEVHLLKQANTARYTPVQGLGNVNIAQLSSSTTPVHYTAPVYNSHAQLACEAIAEADSEDAVALDGYTLNSGSLIRAARFGAPVEIKKDAAIEERINASVIYLKSKLHLSLYGISTGYGGSADTRTEELESLQISLIEHQLAGVTHQLHGTDGHKGRPRTIHDPLRDVMPEAIVRGAMVIRVNSLVRGHSAVRLQVLQTILKLLEKNLTPVVPLRGSISASGDLQPLAYVAAAICGHPDIMIMDRSSPKSLSIIPAPEALAKHGIEKITLGPKEGLGLINGTAFSASAAVLASHDAHALALLSQALTALSIEAMVGQAGNFHPFIHEVCRPHPGQVEAAASMLKMLNGSRLAVHKEEERVVNDELDQNVLRQDRYPLRTAPQWLGPQLEDLTAVQKTLTCEINSTTDNPLLDIEGDHIHHGGNFQATHVAQAMEKTRLALYMMGKLAFSQATELINCTMNKGLPSCLAGDEPSTNYHAKGLDINMAAYTAELGYLAGPVSTHVQSAEQHNQAVNSMALVSARYTIEAVDTLSMLLSAHLYTVCQAVDLRVMDLLFRQAFADSLPAMLRKHFATYQVDGKVDALTLAVLRTAYRRLESTGSMDSGARFTDAFQTASSVVMDALSTYEGEGNPLKAIAEWKQDGVKSTTKLYVTMRDEYLSNNTSAADYLGNTRALYVYVRETLGIKARRGDVFYGSHQRTIGSDVGKIHAALRDGSMYGTLKGLFEIA